MTDARPVRRPRLRSVSAAAIVAFVLVLALLVAQMRLGRDPVLGARRVASAAAPRQVVLRRVIVKRVVVDEIHDVDGGGAASSSGSIAVAPRTSAPTPAPAPAPAPSPAPLVTKSS
jgi:hypothetical protein